MGGVWFRWRKPEIKTKRRMETGSVWWVGNFFLKFWREPFPPKVQIRFLA